MLNIKMKESSNYSLARTPIGVRIIRTLVSMSRLIPQQTRLAVVRTLGRTLGITCFAIGKTFRSQWLCVLGLPSVAEHNFRHRRFDAASAGALQLLRFAEAEPNDWNYGNAVHKAHLMLGRVAFARGDLDTAGAELLASARVPGSPQLASFGPNMQLALELLQAGRKDICSNISACATSFGRRVRLSYARGRAISKMADCRRSVATYFTSNAPHTA